MGPGPGLIDLRRFARAGDVVTLASARGGDVRLTLDHVSTRWLSAVAQPGAVAAEDVAARRAGPRRLPPGGGAGGALGRAARRPRRARGAQRRRRRGARRAPHAAPRGPGARGVAAAWPGAIGPPSGCRRASWTSRRPASPSSPRTGWRRATSSRSPPTRGRSRCACGSSAAAAGTFGRAVFGCQVLAATPGRRGLDAPAPRARRVAPATPRCRGDRAAAVHSALVGRRLVAFLLVLAALVPATASAKPTVQEYDLGRARPGPGQRGLPDRADPPAGRGRRAGGAGRRAAGRDPARPPPDLHRSAPRSSRGPARRARRSATTSASATSWRRSRPAAT